jgi:hypothetical protein
MARPLSKLSLVSKTILVMTVLCATFWFCSENRFGFANGVSEISEQPEGWFKGNEVTVKVALPRKDASLTWEFNIYPAGDIRIQATTVSSGQVINADMIVLQGKLLFVKGLEGLTQENAIDLLDQPVLYMQQVLKILAHIFPQGPERINGEELFNFTEKDTPIHVATSSASGTYEAPWIATGSLKKDEQGRIHYDLSFLYVSKQIGKQVNLKFDGTWNFQKNKQALDYGLDVQGYDVFSLGVRDRNVQGQRSVDYGTTKQKSYTTLSEAQEKYLKETE